MNSRITKAEAATAALLTIAAIWLRVVTARSAGALWRDEVNTVGLATLPSLSDVWKNLQFDSFPILWILIVRWLAAIAGPMNDSAFRLLGLVIGIAVVASLWWYARAFRYFYPLLSLALLALSPTVILWGDSMRGLGAGMLFMIMAGLLLWQFLEKPTLLRFAFATLAAAASVQTLVYNAVFLLAFSAGAIAVCIDRRDWRTGGGAVAVAGIAALSIVPYAATIRAAANWTMVVQIPHYTLFRFWSKLYEALYPGGTWSFVIWCDLLLLALAAAVLTIRRPEKFGLSLKQKEVALFSTVTLLAAWPAFFLFLRALSYPTRPWYYVSLLAISAVCVDTISGSLLHGSVARILRLIGVLTLGCATLIPASVWVAKRLTNIDAVAARVQREATPHDLIVVTPWYHAVTFARYYRGTTPWTTLPPTEFHRYHRYDLIKQKMMIADQHVPVAVLEQQISATLRSGRRVFLVGNLPDSQAGTLQVLPAAPLRGNQWPHDLYQQQWSSMIADFLKMHAAQIHVLANEESSESVSDLEDDALIVATGWRP